MINYTVSC